MTSQIEIPRDTFSRTVVGHHERVDPIPCRGISDTAHHRLATSNETMRH